MRDRRRARRRALISVCVGGLILVACRHHGHDGRVLTVGAATSTAALSHTHFIDPLIIGASFDGAGDDALHRLVALHLASVGLLGAPVARPDRLELTSALPTPGYALRATIERRTSEYSVVRIEAISSVDGASVARAPWWVIDSLDAVHRELLTLRPPRRRPISATHFEQLRSAAQAIRARGGDRPLSADEYRRCPRPVRDARNPEYYAPSLDAPSQIGPRPFG